VSGGSSQGQLTPNRDDELSPPVVSKGRIDPMEFTPPAGITKNENIDNKQESGGDSDPSSPQVFELKQQTPYEG
jgi:hypothetical protein